MILWLFIFSSTLWARELSLLTLNLHGLHPMGEERRLSIQQNGKKEIAWSHLFYFTPAEINRGLRRRQEYLARQLSQLKPHLIFFQEVGSPLQNASTHCQDFLKSNTAQDIKNKLSGYAAYHGCRGNIGWKTDLNTFNTFSVYTESGNLIYQRGDNPFPQGMITEGMSILAHESLKVLDHQQITLPINQKRESFFFHILKFTLPGESNWWLAVNIHGGHKVQHFEQAVATRHFLSRYLNSQKDFEQFAGFIVAGDFNAFDSSQEVSTIPWSFHAAWQTRTDLEQKLNTLNASSYKPFATLNYQEASNRISAALDGLFNWFSLRRHPHDGSLKEVSLSSPCRPLTGFNPLCDFQEKIDHIYLSESMLVKSFSGIYRQNNWTDLSETTSDHPGLYSVIELKAK